MGMDKYDKNYNPWQPRVHADEVARWSEIDTRTGGPRVRSDYVDIYKQMWKEHGMGRPHRGRKHHSLSHHRRSTCRGGNDVPPQRSSFPPGALGDRQYRSRIAHMIKN
jgi:hypothetical protein